MPFRRDRLREVREQKGITQRELASLCGITEFQISRYETGKTEPIAGSLELLAQHLSVSADYLLGLSFNPRGQLGDSELTEEEQIVLQVLRNDGWPGIFRLGAERISR